jgi:hypothetical protein
MLYLNGFISANPKHFNPKFLECGKNPTNAFDVRIIFRKSNSGQRVSRNKSRSGIDGLGNVVPHMPGVKRSTVPVALGPWNWLRPLPQS